MNEKRCTERQLEREGQFVCSKERKKAIKKNDKLKKSERKSIRERIMGRQ